MLELSFLYVNYPSIIPLQVFKMKKIVKLIMLISLLSELSSDDFSSTVDGSGNASL